MYKIVKINHEKFKIYFLMLGLTVKLELKTHSHIE
jgi:hypothetical protein